jgi:amidase
MQRPEDEERADSNPEMNVTAHELAFAGPAALAELVRRREVRPRELVELFLARIERLDPQLKAFRVVMSEQALAAADAADHTDGPLAGVPIAIKDDQPVAGQAVTRGSRSHGPPESADGELVKRLRQAGAIPVGITNVPELMIWPWTATVANGVTRNPWNPARTTGGSSGGSAAAVAAGMVPAATGSDGGGSIRIPAACCGLVGMKPSRGLVPGTSWVSMSVFGALARTVKDSALLLEVLARPGGDPFVKATASEPGRLRIAASRKLPAGVLAKLTDDQRSAWERTRDLLADLGHEVTERDPDYGLKMLEFAQTWVRGIYEDSWLVPDRNQLERSTRGMASAGRMLVSKRRRDALLAHREQTTGRILALWDQCDVLLTPGLSCTAIAAEGALHKSTAIAFDRAARFTPWTPLFNLTGQPAIAVPAGFGADGLPCSVQLVGRHGAETTLYSLAAQLEQARPWADRRPPIS